MTELGSTVPGLVDLHFHLLPGVDDGPETLTDTVELLLQAHAEGVRHVVATPHMYLQPFDNYDSTAILRAFEEMYEELDEISRRLDFLRDIELSLGAENYVCSEFFEALDDRDVITLAGGDHVLLEISNFMTFELVMSAIERVKSVGLHPVLAHVERYAIFRDDWSRLETLAREGCLLQINTASVLGQEGRRLRRFCDRMLKRGLAHLVASDAHNTRSRRPGLGRAFEALSKRLSYEDATLLTKGNAELILGTLHRHTEARGRPSDDSLAFRFRD